MNKLKIVYKSYSYEIDGVVQAKPHWQSEFMVDEMPLAQHFDFEGGRLWFGQTVFESSNALEIDMLRGNLAPSNQFDNARLVLYRCHCGNDLCGVISCEIERNGNKVIWRDIREETDQDSLPDYDAEPITEFVFDTLQYDAAISAHEKLLSESQH
jgi:hypothetical protein